MSKTTTAYVKLVRDEHGTIIHSENADDLVRDAVAAEREACADMVFRYISQTVNMEARGCLASVAYDIRARGQA